MTDNKVLSSRELELAVLAWRAVEEPKIDYEKLAEVANFKNSNSARATFGPVRKKLLEGGYASSPNASPKPKRSAAAAVAGGASDDNPTPTKKPRGRPKKTAAPAPAPAQAPAPVKKEEEVEEEDDDEPEDLV